MSESKTHLIADESLGGVLREYVEVERKADVGDYVISNEQLEFTDRIYKVYHVGDFSVLGRYNGGHTHLSNYRTLEPTDIVHIDGQRYRMVDRKAEVGEKVIVVNKFSAKDSHVIGDVLNVEEVYFDGSGVRAIDNNNKFPLHHGEYRNYRQNNGEGGGGMAVTKPKPKPKVLLVGKLRAGKSVVAHVLVHKYGFHELAFGSALKRFAQDIFWASETDGKPRALYQQFGELCRRIDPMVWVRFVDVQVDVLERSPFNSGIVVSDGRQPHEVEWARNKGFVIVRVSAPDEVRIERALRAGDVFTDDELSHETERYVDEFEVDYEIVNDGTFDELKAKVDEVITRIKERGG